MFTPIKTTDFSAIKLRLASPDKIKEWSYGEVLKPETVNYRTQRPEKDGLFCEKIFGPSKDWECYCGKYKKIRYKGIICDKCGVEVTRAVVRRERMGHVELSCPVSHIWFLRNIPSRIGLILDVSIGNLEKVIYFASFIVTHVDATLKQETLEKIKQEYISKKKSIEAEFDQKQKNIENKLESKDIKNAEAEKTIKGLFNQKDLKLEELEDLFSTTEKELKDLKRLQIISEAVYQDLSLKYGHIFEAGIGAEAILKVLSEIKMEESVKELEELYTKSKGAKREKLIKRIRLYKSLIKNKISPEWMILRAIPIIPPDLRPMVPLDGGRFATSDLNDLYRRVINRNNRLKQLLELRAPEVITRNEKRMLQEAVDALIDNGARHSKTVTASTGQKRMLKSLADMLKGKQGRFRQNLLGKRTDYSGRSVIVVGPNLRLRQCGIPKKMALELFKPFVISQLIAQGYVHNVRSGSRFIETDRYEVWDILEEIIKDAFVLLNRAPTLHRLGIQAFKPVLIEGKAIQVHPLVCSAFNADFDGDQMAVHVPLTKEAKKESANLMLSAKNLLSPARGETISAPSKDMVWGCYYMTSIPKKFISLDPEVLANDEEAIIRHNLGYLPLRKKIKIKMILDKEKGEEWVETTVGRIIFNRSLPEQIPFQNEVMDAGKVKGLANICFEKYSIEETADFLDEIKRLGYEYITVSGLSWGMDDIPVLKEKPALLQKSQDLVDECTQQYEMGLLTKKERYSKIISIWTEAKDKVIEVGKNVIDPDGSVYSMVHSGARGSVSQLVQIVGMKGLVANPSGEIIELPVKGSFKDGLDVLEYFISTHGARKGLADTALRTANSGYLTRRLVDVAQDVIIREEDCGTENYIWITEEESEEMSKTVAERIIGRFLAGDLKAVGSNKIIKKKGEVVDNETFRKIKDLNLDKVKVRSVIKCQSRKGICQKCYGWDLGVNEVVRMGTAVGIIAAQSIGEPGTQLTMRTFHTGGVAGTDITQGLPRVEEIFEVRSPKHKAVLCDVDGKVSIDEVELGVNLDEDGESALKQKVIKVKYRETEQDKYIYETGKKKKADSKISVKVKAGDSVAAGNLLYIDKKGNEVLAERSGIVSLEPKTILISTEVDKIAEYLVPVGYKIYVEEGDLVTQGTALTEGSMDLISLFKLRELDEVQKYIVKEIQHIYSSQGQRLNDKHIEVMVRQLCSRVNVKDVGDTNLLEGDVVDLARFEYENKKALIAKKEPAQGDRLILGISKVALSTDSFLSAASFQETAKVLIHAALTGKVDHLEGLKENVIIGRLIPAGTGFKENK